MLAPHVLIGVDATAGGDFVDKMFGEKEGGSASSVCLGLVFLNPAS